MTEQEKISPAFEHFLAGAGRNERCDAIVFYRAPRREKRPPRGRLRRLKARLDFVKEQAAAQSKTHSAISRKYEREFRTEVSGHGPLRVSAIGESALPVSRAVVTRKSLSALAEDKNVVAILPNQRIQLIQPRLVDYDALVKQEVKDGLTWGLKQLDIPALWATTKGRDINVAVLDTGVHGDHPALKGRIGNFVVIDPLGRRIAASPTFDGGQHGTHVCGTIAGGKAPDGVSIGVAPEANILAAGVLVGESTLVTLLEGISWAVENGADVINMSLGFKYYEPHFTQVFDYIIEEYGTLPVVAVGNENHGNTSSPGSAYNALSVGAAEKISSRKTEVAAFSSGASLVFPGGDPDRVTKPDLVAPGVQVYSCIPPERRPDGTYEYTYMDGSSMATPHVSGVVALLMAAKPDAPVEDIVEALKDTAKHPSGDARPDNRWGYGMIRPMEALNAL